VNPTAHTPDAAPRLGHYRTYTLSGLTVTVGSRSSFGEPHWGSAVCSFGLFWLRAAKVLFKKKTVGRRYRADRRAEIQR
jgi:hypothetical protein